MLFSNFKGYLEARDISLLNGSYLAYPSKNCLIYKGKIMTRLGIKNDGVVPTNTERVHSECVWKDSAAGLRFLRGTGQNLQLKYDNKWITILDSLSSDLRQVRFATWVDGNDSIVHKRLFFCDGSTNLYQWNGAVSKVSSWDGSTDTLTLDVPDTCEKEGYDKGDTTAQTIIIFSLDSDGNVDNVEEVDYNNDPSTGNTLSLASTPSHTPEAGDIVVAKPVTFADAISADFNIDLVYSFKNHMAVASHSKTELYFSHIDDYSLDTGLNFTMPAAADRTATTAIYFNLDGNVMALMSKSSKLWVSDENDWYKITKLTDSANAYDMWVSTDKLETAESKGAYPMAVANHKGDLIYLARDNTIQRIRTNEITGKDEFKLLSSNVENLLNRLDKTDVRIKYYERYIYIIFPTESTMVMLDVVGNYWQPPQMLPISDMSVVEGQKYGHSNAKDETFELFSGRNDLGTDIEADIAFGYHPFTDRFRYDEFDKFGISCRFTVTTEVNITYQYEFEGAKKEETRTFLGSDVKTYSKAEDASWAEHPWGTRSLAGSALEEDMYKAFVFDKPKSTPFFEFRPVFTIRGKNNEFHLLAWWAENYKSARQPGNNLYLNK